jgi:hypothetical protein
VKPAKSGTSSVHSTFPLQTGLTCWSVSPVHCSSAKRSSHCLLSLFLFAIKSILFAYLNPEMRKKIRADVTVGERPVMYWRIWNGRHRAVLPNLGYAYANMKGKIYGNRLPRGTQVIKCWQPLPLIPKVPSGVRVR